MLRWEFDVGAWHARSSKRGCRVALYNTGRAFRVIRDHMAIQGIFRGYLGDYLILYLKWNAEFIGIFPI